MTRTLGERLKIDQAVSPQDIDTADVTSSYFAMQNYGRVLATVNTASISANNTATVQILQATDDQGADVKALTTVTTVTAGTGGEALFATAEAKASEMDDGFTHVAAKVTSTEGTAVDGAALLVRGDSRYEPAV